LDLRQSKSRKPTCAKYPVTNLKLVYPQAEARPDSFEHLRFEHFFLQRWMGRNAIAIPNLLSGTASKIHVGA